MNRRIVLSILLISITVGMPAGSHVDNPFLPKGCGSCHVGHGMSNQPMLDQIEEDFCYKCHGSEEDRTKMIAQGKLAPGANSHNIKEVFSKPYRHPVEEGMGHSPTEKLPSSKGAAVSHAECVDCHNPHQRTGAAGNQVYEVQGYSLTGQYKETATYEYELCLKCHADYVGYDQSGKNLMSEFAQSVKSQHPVTRPARGINNSSLIPKISAMNMMKCSACHTNDDPNGPKGPHGSNHRFMLSGNYDVGIYAQESPYAFEFCYSCHERTSILSDESFPYHSLHILGDPLENIPGTSCFTCHASHSSRDNPFLIEFNPKAVSIDKDTQIINYLSSGNNSGECYLNCHGHAHSPARY